MTEVFTVELPHGPRARYIKQTDEIIVEDNLLVIATGFFDGDGVKLERDHFPGRVVMMGSDQIEGMAETAIQIVQKMPEYAECQFVLAGVDDCIFRWPVKPSKKEPVKEIKYKAAVFFSDDKKTGWAFCSATVRGRLVSRAMLSFNVVDAKQ